MESVIERLKDRLERHSDDLKQRMKSAKEEYEADKVQYDEVLEEIVEIEKAINKLCSV